MDFRPTGTRSAQVVSVIKTTAKRGLGTEKDPIRYVDQYWDFDGKLLAENDKEDNMELLKIRTEKLKAETAKIEKFINSFK